MTDHDKENIDACLFLKRRVYASVFFAGRVDVDKSSKTMTSQTQKAKTKLATLSASFDDLEAQLAPLFAQTLPESIVGLEPIQQAKLHTVLPYLVYDLVFSRFGVLPRMFRI